MPNESQTINAVEHSLRYKIQITGDENRSMILSERMAHYRVPGVSIAVINQGQLEWAKAYGTRTSAPESSDIDSDTLFQAASISKAINALGALILVQSGLLSLDEDINQYLTTWKISENEFTYAKKITLRRLLSHSAGISVHGFPGYQIDAAIPTTLDILEGKQRIVKTEPVRVIQEPGATFRYSGGGTTIIQFLVEEITGEKYDAWMQKHVLTPLHMNRSTFTQPLPKEIRNEAACGHQSDGTAVNGGWHVYPEMAAAGLWTTPTDLAHFIVEILKILKLESRLLQAELMREAITPQISIAQWYSDTISEASGLGFFLGGSADNLKISHDGGNAGFISRFIALPQQGQGFVIMVNNEGAFGLIDEITHSIADVYGMRGFESIKKSESSIGDIGEYSGFLGTYKHEDDELIISQHDDKLFLSFPYSQEMQLHREKDNIFFVKEGSDVVKLIGSQDNEYKVHIFSRDTEIIYTNIENALSLKPG